MARYTDALATRSALETLQDAKKRNVHWLDVVGALRTLEAGDAVDDRGRPWNRVVAEISKYTVHQLRQMERTLETFENLEALERRLTIRRDDLLRMWPLSHLEIFARMARINQPAAIQKIVDVLGSKKPPGYRELRDHFYDLRAGTEKWSPVAVGKYVSRSFKKLCFEMLKQTNASLCFDREDKNEHFVAEWPAGFRYASPDLMITTWFEGGKVQIDAVDCYLIYGDIAQEETTRRILNAATRATFFDHFWLALPTWSEIALAKSLCADLELFNIGILAVDPESKKMRVAQKPSKPPVPDRRRKLRDAIKTANLKIEWTK